MQHIRKYIVRGFQVVSRNTCSMATALCLSIIGSTMVSCVREPELHLHEGNDITMKLPEIKLNLDVMWNYLFKYDVEYDWQSEWYYGWDETDKSLFGEIGYTEPTAFDIRRYYNGKNPLASHTAPYKHYITGRTLSAKYDYGYWDFLAWNDIQTSDGVQSVRIDEASTYDYVTASTGQTMHPAAYNAPAYTRAFYQPEELFAGYEDQIDINENLDGFVYDEATQTWVRQLHMTLQPMTYIYLLQVILHHNNRSSRIITSIDGSANLSGMARMVTLNTGQTGDDAITVNTNMRMKFDQKGKNDEAVDIIGGKVLTFGIPKLNPYQLDTRSYTESLKKVADADLNNRHYLEVEMQFYNGMDSTFVFDVTDQVRKLYRGGVITVELDMDHVPIPSRSGGSGFDAVVKDYDEKEWEFEM